MSAAAVETPAPAVVGATTAAEEEVAMTESAQALLVQRMNFLSLVQELAQRDVEKCIQMVGLEAVLARDHVVTASASQQLPRTAVRLPGPVGGGGVAGGMPVTATAPGAANQQPPPQPQPVRQAATTQQPPPRRVQEPSRRPQEDYYAQQPLPPSASHHQPPHPMMKYPHDYREDDEGDAMYVQGEDRQQQQYKRKKAPAPRKKVSPPSPHRHLGGEALPTATTGTRHREDLSHDQKLQVASIVAQLQLAAKKQQESAGATASERKNAHAAVTTTGTLTSPLVDLMKPKTNTTTTATSPMKARTPRSPPPSPQKHKMVVVGSRLSSPSRSPQKKSAVRSPQQKQQRSSHLPTKEDDVDVNMDEAVWRHGQSTAKKGQHEQQQQRDVHRSSPSPKHEREARRSDSAREVMHENLERVLAAAAAAARGEHGGAEVDTDILALDDVSGGAEYQSAALKETQKTILESLERIEREQDEILSRAEEAEKEKVRSVALRRPEERHQQRATGVESFTKFESSRKKEKKRLRGSIPPEMIESIQHNKEEVRQYVKYNESLWNNSAVSQEVFAERLTKSLFGSLCDEVLDEVTDILDDYVEGLVEYELQ